MVAPNLTNHHLPTTTTTKSFSPPSLQLLIIRYRLLIIRHRLLIIRHRFVIHPISQQFIRKNRCDCWLTQSSQHSSTIDASFPPSRIASRIAHASFPLFPTPHHHTMVDMGIIRTSSPNSLDWYHFHTSFPNFQQFEKTQVGSINHFQFALEPNWAWGSIFSSSFVSLFFRYLFTFFLSNCLFDCLFLSCSWYRSCSH